MAPRPFNLAGPTRSELAQSDLIRHRLPGSKFFSSVDLGCIGVSGAARDLVIDWVEDLLFSDQSYYLHYLK